MGAPTTVRPAEQAKNACFGFSFLLAANGAGPGANPKIYSALTPTNQFLLGFTDDAIAGVTLGWESDPGDNIFPPGYPSVPAIPPTSRAYPAAPGPFFSPNNIRLSQVSLKSLTASYGIRALPGQNSLPTGFAYGRNLFNLGAQPDNSIVGDFAGCRRVRVSLISPGAFSAAAHVGFVLLNGSIPLTRLNPTVELDVNNLGDITVVNMSTDGAEQPAAVQAVVGVHVELNM